MTKLCQHILVMSQQQDNMLSVVLQCYVVASSNEVSLIGHVAEMIIHFEVLQQRLILLHMRNLIYLGLIHRTSSPLPFGK